tara:strand:- start:806 stop:1450 length:645 start_codon:yes stop_codon:yes gene_type:complete
MKKLIMFLTLTTLIVSCSKNGDDRIAEQEEIRTREQIEAQNENQKEWAEKLEKDLNDRKRFIKSIEGRFNGIIDVRESTFEIQAKFISSIPIEFSNRVRTLDEINYELQNLNLNLFVKLENPRVSNSAVTCVVEGYRPDIKNGLINIITESCKNSFTLSISNSLETLTSDQRRMDSRALANQVLSGAVDIVEFIQGDFEPSTSSQKFKFQLRRE